VSTGKACINYYSEQNPVSNNFTEKRQPGLGKGRQLTMSVKNEHCKVKEQNCEYLTEWPPGESLQQPSEQFSSHRSGKPPEKQCISPFIYLPPSYKIDVVLAKWWKAKKKAFLCTLSQESLLASIESKSSNPGTVLFQVSR